MVRALRLRFTSSLGATKRDVSDCAVETARELDLSLVLLDTGDGEAINVQMGGPPRIYNLRHFLRVLVLSPNVRLYR